jgi:hypothetical protein
LAAAVLIIPSMGGYLQFDHIIVVGVVSLARLIADAPLKSGKRM